MAEKRETKIIIGKSGGTASEGSVTHRLTIPNNWAKAMGITGESRELCMQFDETEEKIIITPTPIMAKKIDGVYHIVQGHTRAIAMLNIHGSFPAIDKETGERVFLKMSEAGSLELVSRVVEKAPELNIDKPYPKENIIW